MPSTTTSDDQSQERHQHKVATPSGATPETAMLYVGKAVENHTTEVRSMIWGLIAVISVMLIVFTSALFTQCFIMYLIWKQNEIRHQELQNLTISQKVMVEQRNGLFEQALERMKKDDLRGTRTAEN